MKFFAMTVVIGLMVQFASAQTVTPGKVCGKNWYPRFGYTPESEWGHVNRVCITVDQNDQWLIDVSYFGEETKEQFVIVKKDIEVDYKGRTYINIYMKNPNDAEKLTFGRVALFPDDPSTIMSYLGKTADKKWTFLAGDFSQAE